MTLKIRTRPRPRWYQPELAELAIARCIAVTIAGPCPSPAVAYVIAGCAHDHLREGLVCGRHLDDADGALCNTCAAGGGRAPHDCVLSIYEVQHREA